MDPIVWGLGYHRALFLGLCNGIDPIHVDVGELKQTVASLKCSLQDEEKRATLLRERLERYIAHVAIVPESGV